MRALRRVMSRLLTFLTVKAMDIGLAYVRACRCYQHQLMFLLLLGTWWFGPCGAWPSPVIVGWTPSLLVYVFRPVVPLGISWVPSIGIIVVAIIITTIIILPIVLIVATVVVVAAIVITSAVVVIATVVIVTPVVFVAVVIVLPIVVVISVSVAGAGSLRISRSWSRSSSWRLRHLWFNLSDRCGIAVEQIIFA